MIYKIPLLFFLLISSTAAFSYHKEFRKDTPCREGPERNLKLNFSQRSNEKNAFLVGWNLRENHEYLHTQKPELGGEIAILRCLPPGRYVVVARGSVNKLNGSLVEAQVNAVNDNDVILGKATPEWMEAKNLVWRPMVGDEVLPIYKRINKVLVASPQFKFNRDELFVQQEGGGSTYTLSEEGQNLLKEKFERLKNRNGRLLVEGFVLSTGDKDKLRTESLMRAQTVSAFLIREYALQPSQVVPIGYGNDWMETGMQAVNNQNDINTDSGIILKMLNE
jgi:outer membrane protein OmpA-like peptidoglycan-associated protein